MYCYKCKKNKIAILFSHDRSQKSGMSNRCKECDLIKRQESRKKYPEHYRLIDKKYNLKHKEQRNAYSREYRKKYQYKIKAHTIVTSAIKAGLLKRESCHKCNSIINVEAHHDDYSKPLKVEWLCRFHHRRAKHNNII
jgi:hypothetical protein